MFYPTPFQNPGLAHPTKFNTSLVLDTDSIYHGVDPVGGFQHPPPVVGPGSHLVHVGNGRWCVTDANGVPLPTYQQMSWSDIRMSVQWKAYIFCNEAAHKSWLDHDDDVSPATAYTTLLEHFYGATKLNASLIEDVPTLIELLCQHYIKVPKELTERHQDSQPRLTSNL